MLVITLYDGEAVHIGDDIKIVMDRCIDDGDSTRLGIEAPADVKVLREELVSPDHKGDQVSHELHAHPAAS